MTHDIMVALAGVVVLGVGAQWLAWRLRLPSILLLLVIGVVVGPVTGLLRPDEMFGQALLPLVSVAVALILFEGGLSLRLRELAKVGHVVRNLLTIGVLIGWLISAAAGYAILGLDARLAVLLGAILVVTGPTVVMPLLRHVRPVGPVASILKWEGIAIDPIGALLAVLAFEVIWAGEGHNPWTHSVMAVVKTIVAGGGFGLLAAGLLVVLMKKYWVPDELQNPIALMLVVAVYAASQLVQEESGLFATTVMGVALANQKFVDVEHIVEFKEDLRVLLIGMLFILLGARLTSGDLARVGWRAVLFVVVLIAVARPLAVFISTWRTGLKRRERVFLAWMAPRGIVAAAVSSVFALRLQETAVTPTVGALAPGDQLGFVQEPGSGGVLVSVTFAVIVGTVTVYGLTAAALARKLGVADPNPQGVLIIGVDRWSQAVGQVLMNHGFRVLIVDTNYHRLAAARMAGIPTYRGSILSEYAMNEMDLGGIGRLLATTPNDEVNVLAAQRFTPVFGRAEIYRLAPASSPTSKARQDDHAHTRLLFSQGVTYEALQKRMAKGDVIKATPLSEEFDYEAFLEMYGPETCPLFILTADQKLKVITADQPVQPKPGQTVVALVPTDRL